MKATVKLEVGRDIVNHQLEVSPDGVIRAGAGRLHLALDQHTTSVDWAEIVPGVHSVIAGGRSYEAFVSRPSGARHEGPYLVTVGLRHYCVEILDPRQRRYSGSAVTIEGPQEVLAPMPGKIARILVSEDQEVARGEGLLVIEAMKMQNELRAPRSGRIERIYVAEGIGVETASKLLRMV